MKKMVKAFICILIVVVIISILCELFLSHVFLGWNFGLMPSINYMSNPLEKVPEINPIANVNPFDGIYKNPFG